MNAAGDRAAWLKGSEAMCDISAQLLEQPYRMVLLGPPGVGKGTQAELLCERLKACHLSTGDVFRAAQCESEHSPALEQALEAMRRGELVSDELVVEMVRERAGCLSCQGGFLLDGFPRTIGQAEALDAMLDERGLTIDAVICYDLPLEQIVDRLSGRRTCKQCKAVYHTTARPPRQAGVCDHCGGELVQRDDDRPEAIRVRMKSYRESTQPLIEHYRQSGRLLEVSAEGAPEEIFQRTVAGLERRRAETAD